MNTQTPIRDEAMAKPAKYGVIRDLVYSPDDGGWYAQETDLDTGKSRVTKLTYPTKEALEIMLRSTFAKYRWEKWS